MIRPTRVLLGLCVILATACSTRPKGPIEVVEKKDRAAEYTGFGNTAFQEGDYPKALTFFEQALAVNLSVDNERGVVQSLGSLGKVHLAQGDTLRAGELFGRAHDLAALQDDPGLRLQTAVNLAELALGNEDPQEAGRVLTAVDATAEAVQGTADLAIYYHTLAAVERRLREMGGALAHLEQALIINRKLENLRETASNLIVLASINSSRGEYELALSQAQEALALDKQVENSLGIAQDLTALGLLSARMTRHAEAFRYLERAYGVYDALGHTSGKRGVLGYLVEAARNAGKTTEAEAYERVLSELTPQ